MPGSFQNCNHQYRSNLFRLCVSLLNMSMALSAQNAPPHQRNVSYECMNPRCDKSFSNLHRDSYEVHRFHARNVGTLCASLTMLREIVATRRTGVTTSVIRRILSTGKQCAYILIMLMTVLLPWAVLILSPSLSLSLFLLRWQVTRTVPQAATLSSYPARCNCNSECDRAAWN